MLPTGLVESPYLEAFKEHVDMAFEDIGARLKIGLELKGLFQLKGLCDCKWNGGIQMEEIIES